MDDIRSSDDHLLSDPLFTTTSARVVARPVPVREASLWTGREIGTVPDRKQIA